MAAKEHTERVLLLAARQQHSPLFSLPLDIIEDIVSQGGPRARQLCSATAHALDPLPSLTPRGLPKAADLTSALSRHPYLEELDLTHLADLVDDATLLALCSALPHLATLRLPPNHRASIQGLAATASLLPGLTGLHLPTQQPTLALPGPSLEVADIVRGLPLLRHATLPHQLYLAPSLGPAAHLSKLSLFKHDGDWDLVDLSRLARLAGALPSLAALEVDCPLELSIELVGVEERSQLGGLSRLTALKLEGVAPVNGRSPGALLYQLGALTNLRQLQLHMLHAGVTRAEAGWLAHLSLLTCVQINFHVTEAEGGQAWVPEEPADPWGVAVQRPNWVPARPPEGGRRFGAFNEVALAVPHLPALHKLSICDDAYGSCELDYLTSPAFAQISAAAGTLRALHLTKVRFVGADAMETIALLTGLTSLGLLCCRYLHGFEGLARLTNLRELRVWAECGSTPSSALIARHLTKLETLSIVDGRVDCEYLRELGAGLGRSLRVLDLSCRQHPDPFQGGTELAGPGEGALLALPRLEVLDLSFALRAADLKALKVPPSLRQCFLGHLRSAEQQEEARRVLGRWVDVRFQLWEAHSWEPMPL